MRTGCCGWDVAGLLLEETMKLALYENVCVMVMGVQYVEVCRQDMVTRCDQLALLCSLMPTFTTKMEYFM